MQISLQTSQVASASMVLPMTLVAVKESPVSPERT
jgi:hypothetical protein